MTQFPIKLGKALLAAQGKLRGVAKDGTNPHYKSKYATLENVTDTVRPVLQAQGVIFMQAPGLTDENGIMQLTTTFVHAESGEIYSSTIGVPLVKRDPQGVGSAITYACRYSLMALLGLPPVDDDGQAASRVETAKHEMNEPDMAVIDYVARWATNIKNATDGAKLGKLWNDEKAERSKLNWPDDNTFPDLQDRVRNAVSFLKAPAHV